MSSWPALSGSPRAFEAGPARCRPGSSGSVRAGAAAGGLRRRRPADVRGRGGPTPFATAGRHHHRRPARHQPDEGHAHEARREEDQGGRPPADRGDDPAGEGQGDRHPDPRAGVGDPEGEPGHPLVAPGDRGGGPDERELETHRHEHGVGQDDQRDVLGQVDRQPARREEDHRGRQEVAVRPFVVRPAEERAGDRGDDEEHRPGRDGQGPADPELGGEGDRHRGERVQPAVRDRADHERPHERERDARRAPGDRQGHAPIVRERSGRPRATRGSADRGPPVAQPTGRHSQRIVAVSGRPGSTTTGSIVTKSGGDDCGSTQTAWAGRS